MADGALLGKLTTLRAIVLVSKVLPEIRHIYDFAFLEVPSVAVAMVIGSEYVPVPIASLALEDPVIYVHEYRQLSVLEAHMRKQSQDPVGSCRGSRRM